MDAAHMIFGGIVVGAFSLGLYVADRAYHRDRKAWMQERGQKDQMITRQIIAIHELQLDCNELTDDNRALGAQNERLARQRFALMSNGQQPGSGDIYHEPAA